MRKLYTLLFLFMLGSSLSQAQQASQYYFSTKNNVPLEDMTSDAVLIIPGDQNDVSSPSVKLPFTFNFAGKTYTDFTLTDNGILALGALPVSFGMDNNNFGDNVTHIESDVFPVLMPWTDQLQTSATEGISYKTVGTSVGKRKFVVDWRAHNNSGTIFKFQLWLLESSNTIEFVYGEGSNDFFNNALVGIADSQTDFTAINTEPGAQLTSTEIANINKTWPGSGTAYLFNPAQYVPTTPITIANNTVVTNVACNSDNGGSITLGTISGGDGTYTVNWKSNNGYTGTGSTIGGLIAGDYTYTITDASSSSTLTGTVQVTKAAGIKISDIQISPVYTVAGQKANTIYLGYGPQSVTLSAGSVTGGTGSYNYSWSSAPGLDYSSGTSYIARPTVTTNYTLTVKDAANCSATKNFTVNVVDVRCDKDKIIVCQLPSGNPSKAHSLCVNSKDVAELLAKGNSLGSCTNTLSTVQSGSFVSVTSQTSSKNVVQPNPSSGVFTIRLNGFLNLKTTLSVMNAQGAIVAQKIVDESGMQQSITFNLANQPAGLYFVKVSSDNGVTTEKVMIRR